MELEQQNPLKKWMRLEDDPASFWVLIYFQGRTVKLPRGKDFLFVMFEETPEVILFDFPAKNMFAMEKGKGNKLHEMVS